MAYDYKLGTLIDEIQDEAKDTSSSRTRIARYIRQTQDAVLGHHRFSFDEARVSSTLVIADLSYTLPVDHQEVIQLVLSHSTVIIPQEPTYLPPIEFFNLFPLPDILSPALPTHYTDYGHKIYWSCPLDKAYIIGLRYRHAPARLTVETDIPVIPVEFADILFEGGMAGVESYRQNSDIAALHNKRVEERSEDLLGRYGLRKLQPGVATNSRARRA